MKSADTWSEFLRRAAHDVVDPFPGRLAQAWRIALACALTTMMAAVYGIPEAAISCYLVFFVMKPDAAQGSLLAIALTVLVAIVVLLLFMITRWTIDTPALRVLAIAVSSLILLYLGSASKLGELGGIVALVLAFVLTLLDYVPFGEAATRGILYAWLMATMPMACVLAVNLFIGRKPVRVLRQEIAQRLRACADWLAHPTVESRQRLREQVGDGQEDLLARLGVTRMLALARSDELRRLARAGQESYRIAMAVLKLSPDTAPVIRDAIAQQAARSAQALEQGQPAPAPEAHPPAQSLVEHDIWGGFHRMAGTPSHYPATAPQDPFFRPDAWTSPVHMRYAIKVTAAALLCYFIYTAVQWQGIHTALITCYVAALGSVGETTHKLLLRIVGCLIGAALGMASILFLMPHMTSVGAIMALVFAGTLVSAWVWVGNERVSYAGVQVALAFLLTILQGFGPTFDLDTARDRIMGVLLGNCVLYFMMTQLWPVGVIQRAWDSVQQALSHLAQMARPAPAGMSEQDARDVSLAQASKLAACIAQTKNAMALARFEGYRQRPSPSALRRVATAALAVRQLSERLTLAPSRPDASVVQRVDRIAEMAEANFSINSRARSGTRFNAAATEASVQDGPPDDAAETISPAVPSPPHAQAPRSGDVSVDRTIHRLEALVDVR